MLALGLAACAGGTVAPPAEAPPPPVATTGATMPDYFLASHPGLRVAVEAPSEAPYRATLLGSNPQTVKLTFGNVGTTPWDLSNARVAFDVRRGAVRIPCAARNDLPRHELRVLPPGQTTTVLRDLCSLPLPGDYVVDVRVALKTDGEPQRAGSFSFVVTAAGPNVPHEIAEQPGLFAAMGGNLTGVRYTQPEWQSGAYHVVVRLTNASTNPIRLPHPAQVVFRVTKQGHPLACTATYDLPLPAEVDAGESAARSVPVTCLVDVQGKYDIHASLAMGGEETRLANLGVEVTSNPLLYLPILPW